MSTLVVHYMLFGRPRSSGSGTCCMAKRLVEVRMGSIGPSDASDHWMVGPVEHWGIGAMFKTLAG